MRSIASTITILCNPKVPDTDALCIATLSQKSSVLQVMQSVQLMLNPDTVASTASPSSLAII